MVLAGFPLKHWLKQTESFLPGSYIYHHKFVSLTKHFRVLGAEIWAGIDLKGLKQYGSDHGAWDYMEPAGLQNDH